jgi:hypothetical protein
MDGGVLAPGESSGCLTTGNLTFESGSTYEYEIAGTTECAGYDQTRVFGTVTLGNGTLDVRLLDDFTLQPGQTFKIIDNDGADAVGGTFSDLAEGATFTVDGAVFRISYVGGDGNDVVLSVVTVPDAPILVLLS